MSTTNQNRVFVTLKLPLPVPELIKATQGILAAQHEQPAHPESEPAGRDALRRARRAGHHRGRDQDARRGHGAGAQRGAHEPALAAPRQQGQRAAAGGRPPEQAEAIVTSAGMAIRKAAGSTKPPFAAKPGAVSGTVGSRRGRPPMRASYEWAWSGDGGKTWTSVLPTLQAKTEIPGLPVATTVQFRFRAVTKEAAGDWSQPTALLVDRWAGIAWSSGGRSSRFRGTASHRRSP